jgi:hypothetical protein
VVVACENTTAPTCGGDCPNEGDECITDSTGSRCFCSPPIVTCDQSAAPVCGGFCREGEQCRTDVTGQRCKCEPLPRPCEESGAPVCGGFCSTQQQCEPVTGPLPICACLPCDSVVPRGDITIVWTSSTRFVWTRLECARVYNVYRAVYRHLPDADNNRLSDDYGKCLLNDLLTPEATDTTIPAPSFVHYYLVTAENAVGEGSMGTNAFGMTRPNNTPCP